MISPHVPEILASLMVRGVPHDLPHDFSMSFQLITPLTQNFHRFPPLFSRCPGRKELLVTERARHGARFRTRHGSCEALRCGALGVDYGWAVGCCRLKLQQFFHLGRPP